MLCMVPHVNELLLLLRARQIIIIIAFGDGGARASRETRRNAAIHTACGGGWLTAQIGFFGPILLPCPEPVSL